MLPKSPLNLKSLGLAVAPGAASAGPADATCARSALAADERGDLALASPDTCPAPAAPAHRLEMPAIYRAGAETVYVEFIALGARPDERPPIARADLSVGPHAVKPSISRWM